MACLYLPGFAVRLVFRWIGFSSEVCFPVWVGFGWHGGPGIVLGAGWCLLSWVWESVLGIVAPELLDDKLENPPSTPSIRLCIGMVGLVIGW